MSQTNDKVDICHSCYKVEYIVIGYHNFHIYVSTDYLNDIVVLAEYIII